MSFGKLKAYASSTLAHTTKNSIVIIKCGNFNKITPLNSPNAFFFIYSFKAKPSYTNLCQAYFSDKQFYSKLVNKCYLNFLQTVMWAEIQFFDIVLTLDFSFHFSVRIFHLFLSALYPFIIQYTRYNTELLIPNT